MSDFYHVKKNESDYYAKLRILHIMIVSELLKIQKLCARHYGCARHRGRAQSVMHTPKFWQLSSRNYQNVSRNITLHGDARDRF